MIWLHQNDCSTFHLFHLQFSFTNRHSRFVTTFDTLIYTLWLALPFHTFNPPLSTPNSHRFIQSHHQPRMKTNRTQEPKSNFRELPLKAALYTLSMWNRFSLLCVDRKAYLVSECETEIIFVRLHNTKQALLTPNTNQFSLQAAPVVTSSPAKFYFMYVTKEIINVNNKLRIIKHSKHIFHGKLHCLGFVSNVATR